MASVKKHTVRWKTKAGEERSAQRWRVRYFDDAGTRHTKDFALKREAEAWLDEQTSKLVTGTHVAPRTARTTVDEWCDIWLAGYGTRRASTVRQAATHIAQIKKAFGSYQLQAVRPSQVRAWCSQLKAAGHADSYVYALHARLAQLYFDAIEDGLVVRSPCSRKTAPPMGRQKPYVISTEQLWELYDVVPTHVRPAVLVGAFLGARDAEACGMDVVDLDLMRGVWRPRAQYPDEPLKTESSQWPVPMPRELSLELAAHIQETEDLRKGAWLLTNQWGDRLAPWTLQRAIRAARSKVPGLSEAFSFHDLRHYYASMLIADGADVKKVQAALRHASATTTLDTYSHLWPDSDDAIRSAGERVLRARVAERERAAE